MCAYSDPVLLVALWYWVFLDICHNSHEDLEAVLDFFSKHSETKPGTYVCIVMYCRSNHAQLYVRTYVRTCIGVGVGNKTKLFTYVHFTSCCLDQGTE